MLRLNLASEPEWLGLGCAGGDQRLDGVAAGASEAELALALAKAMAGIAILDWEGVGDADGNPVPITPEAATALMDVWPLFEAFQARYVAKGLLLDQEKNVSAPSPSGTSVGAAATAKPARRRARTARAG